MHFDWKLKDILVAEFLPGYSFIVNREKLDFSSFTSIEFVFKEGR